MQRSQFIPTLNLDEIDAACGDLDYIVKQSRNMHADIVMSNNFAFGGINTSLIFKRVLTTTRGYIMLHQEINTYSCIVFGWSRFSSSCRINA